MTYLACSLPNGTTDVYVGDADELAEVRWVSLVRGSWPACPSCLSRSPSTSKTTLGSWLDTRDTQLTSRAISYVSH
jgi:hypothetical protein